MRTSILAGWAVTLIFGLGSLASAEGMVEVWSVEGGMEFPLDIGFRGRADLKNNIYLTAGLGFAPEFLTNSNAAFQTSFGLSDDKEASAAAQALAGSTVIELRVGMSLQKYLGEGWYADLSYSYYTGGRGHVKVGDLQQATKQIYPTVFNLDSKVSVQAQIHNLGVHCGYDLAMNENFHLMFEGGLVKPLSVTTNLSAPDYLVDQPRMQDDFDKVMNDVFVSQGFYLTGAIWASYLF